MELALLPERWADAESTVVKTPVDSTTYSAPALAHGMALGSRSENTAIAFPFMESFPHLVLVTSTSPLW